MSVQFLETLAYFVLMATSVLVRSDGICNALFKTLLSTGLIVTAVMTVIWSLTMHFSLNHNCWLSEADHPQHLPNSCVRLIAIFITAVLLVNAIRKVNNKEK